MKEHLLQNNQNTKWTGEKFEPKSLDLYRINTRDLKAKDEIAFQRVELTLTETIQTIELRPEQTPKYDSELREWKLKLSIQMDNIKEMKHGQEMKNIQYDQEIKNIKHDQEMKNIQQGNELGNMREQIQKNQRMLEKVDDILKISKCYFI
jgi:hypothetical protein